MLRTILRGQVGPDVQAIQDALKIRTPGLALLSDGKFGLNTQAAMIDFQKRNQLKPDGIVGPRTRSILYPLVATTINMVGTKGGGGGALFRLPGLNPRQASLSDFRVPRAPQAIQGSALSPPPGPKLKLDSFQLNPGGRFPSSTLAKVRRRLFLSGFKVCSSVARMMVAWNSHWECKLGRPCS